MTMSFHEEIQREIHIIKVELRKAVESNKVTDIESDTEKYSNFISDVAKLSGKIEGLELAIRIYKKFNLNS